MSGVKYLLNTNFIWGLLKARPEVLDVMSGRAMLASECAYSAVTRMELLGYPDITAAEERVIGDRLSNFSYAAITREVEDVAIAMRRARRVKLPDAIIAATAIHQGLELLTLDVALLSVFQSIQKFDEKF